MTRWTLFIIPVLGILWIPGIIGLTASPRGEVRFPFHSGLMVIWINLSLFMQIWGVRLIWWSIWLSVVWGGEPFHYGSRLISLKLCRLVGLPCGSVCLIQYYEGIETVSQRDCYPLIG